MKTLGQMATLFGGLAAGGYRTALLPTLELIGSTVKKEVENEIGVYQPGIGPFPATAQLADATLERKARYGQGKGGSPDTPLWATGEFHDDVHFQTNVWELSTEIGTNTDYIKFTELGTTFMPPRAVFGPSAMQAIPRIMPAIALAAAAGITGGSWSGLGARGVTFTKSTGATGHIGL